MRIGAGFIGVARLGAFHKKNAVTYPRPGYEYKWRIVIKYRDGDIKKTIIPFTNQSPLSSFNFKINQRGGANGKLHFVFFDFTLDMNDQVLIYYKGRKIYTGLVNTIPPGTGGAVNLVPQREKLNQKGIYSYSNQDILSIIQDVIKKSFYKTGIFFNAYLLSNTFKSKAKQIYKTVSFKKALKNIIDDLVKEVDDKAIYGVNENNIFFIRYQEESTTYFLLPSKEPFYCSIDSNKNNEGVKFTRAYVYKKGSGNGSSTVYAGKVGFLDTPDFPQIPIEKVTGIKEDIVTFSDETGTEPALKKAYSQILEQTIKKPVIVNGIDLEKFFPEPLKKIHIEENENKIVFTLIDCNSLDHWTGNVQEEKADFVEGVQSIKINGQATFNKNRLYRIKGLEKLTIYIKPASFSDITIYLDSYSFTFRLETISWKPVNIPFSRPFQMLRIEAGTPLLIDRIQAYGFYSLTYQGYIKEVDFKADTTGENHKLTLNSYEKAVNQNQEIIKQIETISTAIMED